MNGFRPHLTSALAGAALLVCASHAQAQNKMAPGLWENSFTTSGMGGDTERSLADAQKKMAAMPPEQRKMIEAMMAKQGVSLGGGAGKPTTVKTCVTPEMAARDAVAMQDGRCKVTQQSRSASSVKFKFECGGEAPSKGEGEYSFSGDKSYSGKTTIDRVVGGKPDRMEITNSGKWLGADCGAIKPVGTPGK
jgi:hypothetical protein